MSGKACPHDRGGYKGVSSWVACFCLKITPGRIVLVSQWRQNELCPLLNPDAVPVKMVEVENPEPIGADQKNEIKKGA